MLKNKEERKAYLLNDENWNSVYDHPSIFTSVKQMILIDGTIIIREDVLERDEFNISVCCNNKSNIRSVYRIVRSKYVTHPLSISFLVDLLGKT